MDKHLTVLGILYIVSSALGLCAAAVLFLAIAGGGVLFGGNATAASISVGVGSILGIFVAAVSVPGLVAGIGLLQRRPWSRILALIVGALHLINIPFGTVLGGYAIWVLVQDESIRLLNAPAVPQVTA